MCQLWSAVLDRLLQGAPCRCDTLCSLRRISPPQKQRERGGETETAVFAVFVMGQRPAARLASAHRLGRRCPPFAGRRQCRRHWHCTSDLATSLHTLNSRCTRDRHGDTRKQKALKLRFLEKSHSIGSTFKSLIGSARTSPESILGMHELLLTAKMVFELKQIESH